MGNRYRQFKVCQFEANPRTGAHIQDLGEIVKNLEKYKSFTQWAWVIHDKDKVTQETIDDMLKTLSDETQNLSIKDEAAIEQYIQNNAWYTLGGDKGKHIHIAIKCENALSFEQVARLLGVPVYCVKRAYDARQQPQGAFLDCVEYLTHENEKEQKAGKHRYPDDEVHANFDWRTELDNRIELEEKYGNARTSTEKAIIDVLKYGKTLHQCYREMDAIEYSKAEIQLKRARSEYLDKNAPLPNTRISICIQGKPGMGKDTLSELLAKALFPDIEDIQDIAFAFGDDNVSFDGYDGQPVIIWSDVRAAGLLSAIGRKSVLHSLEIHPKKGSNARMNVKFGHVRLIHEYNIINGIEPYTEFLEGLAERYTDKKGVEQKSEEEQSGQFYRRMPIVIILKEDSFDILVNKGVSEGTLNFKQYIRYDNVVGNFAQMKNDCGDNEKLLEEISKPAIKKITDLIEFIQTQAAGKQLSEEEVRAKYANVGIQDINKYMKRVHKLGERLVALEEEENFLMSNIAGIKMDYEEMFADGVLEDIRVSELQAAMPLENLKGETLEEGVKIRMRVALIQMEKQLEEVERELSQVVTELKSFALLPEKEGEAVEGQ